MLNQVILVGRIANEPKIIKSENEKEFTIITLAVPRSFKNTEGQYETDFIDCVLWNSIATTTVEYMEKGNMIGIKGRIQNYNKEIQIIAERVTYLSSKHNETNEE